MTYERQAMPEEASEAVRDVLAMCGARWAGHHAEADDYLEGMSVERLRAALRWVPPLVGEALEFEPALSRASFIRATAGQADVWDDRKHCDGRNDGR